MRIGLTRLTPDRHRFEVLRADGSRDVADLETRSYLVHDLTHFTVEKVLRLQHAFFGSLAAGTTLAELNDRSRPWPEGSELARAESIVGPMQSHLSGRAVTLPPWPFVPEVEQRWRSVYGQWKATPFHTTCWFVW
jgi:hypothetical protein